MAIRGRWYSTDGVLSERDLQELADLLTCRLYTKFGHRAYAMARQDVAELIAPYIDDLVPQDQQALAWMVWGLLQEGMDLEFN